MAGKQPTQHRKIDFGDESIKGGFADRPEHFKLKTGQSAVIRLITRPIEYWGANVKPPEGSGRKGFFAHSHADIDAIHAEDTKTMAAQCPLVARGYALQRRFVCLIWVVSISQGGRTKTVNQPYPFAFAGEKYQAITALTKTLPTNPKTQKQLSVHRCEIVINCTDEGFQKMTFNYNGNPTTKYTDIWPQVADLFDGPQGPDPDPEQCSLLRDFLQPEDKRKLIEGLDRVEGRGRFADGGGRDDSADFTEVDPAALGEAADEQPELDEMPPAPAPKPQAVKPRARITVAPAKPPAAAPAPARRAAAPAAAAAPKARKPAPPPPEDDEGVVADVEEILAGTDGGGVDEQIFEE